MEYNIEVRRSTPAYIARLSDPHERTLARRERRRTHNARRTNLESEAQTAPYNMIVESDEDYLRSVAEVAPAAFSIMTVEEILREATIWAV